MSQGQFPPQQQPRPGHESDMQPQPEAQASSYRGSGKLRGKVALVTAADSGIGHAVAVAFAKEGADVAIVYLDSHEDAQKVKQEAEQQGRGAITIADDIGDERFCIRAVQQTVDTLGQLDTERRHTLLLAFHTAAVPYYQYVPEKKRELVQEYLTKPEVVFTELAQKAGVRDDESARYRVVTGLEKLFEHLPEDVRVLYKSPQNVLLLKTAYRSHAARQLWRDSLTDPETGEFTRLSEAATRRWQKEREVRQQDADAASALTAQVARQRQLKWHRLVHPEND